MNTNTSYWIIWALAVMVLTLGLVFPPLMDYDAAQIGTISMSMYQRNDWLTILNRHYVGGSWYDYLDKPHLVYWSAMAGYKIFGLGHVGMRFFSVLSTLVAAYGIAKLGSRLYNKEVGRWASLIFVTSQAIMLANHDVRTDALLTSFTLLSIWQLVVFVDTRKWLPLVAGFLFLALAVASKGLIAAVVAGSAIFFYLMGKKDWQGIFNWKWPAAILIFLAGLSPFLYAYYLQFDMHPEKFVNGSYGNSGVKFLLWSHSVDRFSGNRNLVASPEFSFFFHTILWAFLPWTVLLVTGVFSRGKELWETRFASFFSREQLSFAGVWAIFILMSFAKFKLPHYLNILFPMMSIFSAAWLWQLRENGQSKTIRQLFRVQKGIITILMAALIIIIVWSFPLKSPWVAFGIAGFCALLWQFWRVEGGMADRLVLLTATAALLLNFVLNTHFYPAIGKYQGGSTMAGLIKEKGIDTGSVYLYGKVVRSLDFYTQRFTPVIDSAGIFEELSKGRTLRLYTTDNSGDTLRMQYPGATAVITTPNQKITRLKFSFFNPAKREEGMPKAVLYELRPEGIPQRIDNIQEK